MNEYAFIHIPKCAGMSIKKAIENNPKFRIFDHGVIFNNIPKDLKQVIVIREPTERFTSAFFYVTQHYAKNTKYKDPEMFIQAVLEGQRETCTVWRPQPHFHTLNGHRIATDWVFQPQTDWVDNPHKIILMENLDQGFRELGVELNTGRVNQSRKREFKYSNSSLQYLWRNYERDYLLYNTVKKGDYESNHNWSDGTGWKPSCRPSP